MRDLSKYELDYVDLPFEEHQVVFRRKKVLEFIDHYAPKSILEVGCGLDSISNYIGNDSSESIFIVEPSEVFYKNALLKAKDRSNINIIRGTIQDKVKDLKQFPLDFIVISSLLHELENPEEILISIKHLCHPNTIVHVNVPNAFSFHRILAYEMGLISDCFERSTTQVKMQQHHTFDLNKLILLAENIGFEIVESGSTFVKPFTHEQMNKMLEHKIISQQTLEGLYHLTKYIPDLGSEIFINIKVQKDE